MQRENDTSTSTMATISERESEERESEECNESEKAESRQTMIQVVHHRRSHEREESRT